MVTLIDRPDITMSWTYLATELTVGKRRVSINVLRNLKTTSSQQLLNYMYLFVSAALCSMDDLPLKSEAHCKTKRHAKIMLKIQCADNRCNSEDSDQPARPLSRITSFFPILCTGRM